MKKKVCNRIRKYEIQFPSAPQFLLSKCSPKLKKITKKTKTKHRHQLSPNSRVGEQTDETIFLTQERRIY